AGPWVLTVAGGASVGGARSAASASGMFRAPLHVTGEEENAMHAVIWVIAIVVVALVAFAAFYAAQRQRSRLLRPHFVPECGQAGRGYGERRAAERALVERAERVKRLETRPLPTPRRDELAREWDAVEARFVDDPAGAIADAHGLLGMVMHEQGYPTGHF